MIYLFIYTPSWNLELNLRLRFSLWPEAATTAGAGAASEVKADVVAILGPFLTQCLDLSQVLLSAPSTFEGKLVFEPTVSINQFIATVAAPIAAELSDWKAWHLLTDYSKGTANIGGPLTNRRFPGVGGTHKRQATFWAVLHVLSTG